MKVARGRRSSHTPAASSSRSGSLGDHNATITKLGLMQDKFANDRRRKDAAFAADIFQKANMPKQVKDAAQKMLMDFFGCSTEPSPQQEQPAQPTQQQPAAEAGAEQENVDDNDD